MSPSRAPGDEPAEPLGWVVVWWADGEIADSSKVYWRENARENAEADAVHLRRQWKDVYEFTVEPVGRAEREPRTSEARGFRTDGPGVMDR